MRSCFAASTIAVAAANYSQHTMLAQCADNRFSAGKILQHLEYNNFVVLFENGVQKTLPEKLIVFSDDEDILPLANQSVHVLVPQGNNDQDTYEQGIVESIETNDDGTHYYTVKCESATVTVKATQIYLNQRQAEEINALQITDLDDDCLRVVFGHLNLTLPGFGFLDLSDLIGVATANALFRPAAANVYKRRFGTTKFVRE